MRNTLPGLPRSTAQLLGSLVTVALLGCGSDSGPTNPGSAALQELVGDWEATALIMTSVADPERSFDMVETGAIFTINVQPSGQYTAALTILGFTQTEIGVLTVDGDELVFDRQFPSSDTSRAKYSVSGSTATLEGDTEFDFDGNQSAEPAQLRTELVRR